MAKAKRPPDKRKKLTTDSGAEGVYDGIHFRVTKGVPLSWDETMRRLTEQGSVSVYTMLDNAEQQASNVLLPHITEPGGDVYGAPIQGHSGNFSLKENAPEEAYDAIDVLNQAMIVRGHLEDGNAELAAMFAINVGVLAERMRLRPLGNFAMVGIEAQQRRSRGGARTRKLTAEQERRCCELMDENVAKHVSPTAASVRVAPIIGAEYGVSVSAKTIYKTWKTETAKRLPGNR